MVRHLDLGAIQRGLKNEKALLQERLENTPHNLNADGAVSDLLDLAQDYDSRERKYLIRRQVKRQLALVESALSRLEAGTYGLCTRCGKAINPQRLLVLPAAPWCVDCQAQRASVVLKSQHTLK